MTSWMSRFGSFAAELGNKVRNDRQEVQRCSYIIHGWRSNGAMEPCFLETDWHIGTLAHWQEPGRQTRQPWKDRRTRLAR